MELKEFISTSIKAVIDSIADSQEYALSKGAIINPELHDDQNKLIDSGKAIWKGPFDGRDGKRALTTLDFEIALTASETSENEIGGGLKINVFNASGKSSSKDGESAVSKLKFALNIALPHVDEQDFK